MSAMEQHDHRPVVAETRTSPVPTKQHRIHLRRAIPYRSRLSLMRMTSTRQEQVALSCYEPRFPYLSRCCFVTGLPPLANTQGREIGSPVHVRVGEFDDI